jgi:AraC-like DNA-binding protein
VDNISPTQTALEFGAFAASPHVAVPGTAAWRQRWYSPVKIATLVHVLGEVGVPSAEVLAGTGLNAADLANPDTLTSAQQYYTVLQCVTGLDVPADIGVRMGSRLRVTSFGMYGYALLCAPTLRTALGLAVRYHAMTNPLLPIRWSVDDASLVCVLPSRPELHLPKLDDALYRLLLEIQVATLVTLARDVMGAWCKPTQVSFPWPQPEHTDHLTQALQCPLLFTQTRCTFHFPRDWLDRAPHLADPLTAMQASHACAKLLEKFDLHANLSRSVYRELTRVPGQFPSIERIASVLCMHPRTLRRHLKTEGSSYNALLDSARGALAHDYLCTTQMTIDDIAAALEFSDARSFRNAFKRWTGKTPSEVRAAK